MYKKLIGFFLALILVFGGVFAAQAAEFSLSQDLYKTTSLRGTVSNFYGEMEIPAKKNPNSKVRGLNFGIKAKTESPFYGIAQLNFKSKENKCTYESIEFGGGAEFNTLWDVNTGAEVTFTNPDFTDFSSYEPNLTIFASVDFELFPSPEA